MSNCKLCKADCAFRGQDNPKECRGFIAMTNADRIRAMTDEELAAFLDDCNSQGCVCPAKDCAATCIECIVDWLKQPAEEEV